MAPLLNPAPKPQESPSDRAGSPSNFLRQAIEDDLGQDQTRGIQAAQDSKAGRHRLTSALIHTRFPPEPNGYLHIGHAKSICLNFGLARDYGGRCNMRFDDTNPVKEDQEYVDSILETVRWLGFDWVYGSGDAQETHLYYASDYFEFFYRVAEHLVQAMRMWTPSRPKTSALAVAP